MMFSWDSPYMDQNTLKTNTKTNEHFDFKNNFFCKGIVSNARDSGINWIEECCFMAIVRYIFFSLLFPTVSLWSVTLAE